MDEAFSYRTTEKQRRLDPRAVKLAVVIGFLALALATFALWVSGSEHASFARLRAEGSGTAQVAPDPSPATMANAPDDAQTQEAALAALRVAQQLVASGANFSDAGPARLSAPNSRLTFVHGPSTEPEVVSVAATTSAWAAAVLSPSGTCYLIRLGDGGRVTYGTGLDCTGAAALGAADPSWWSQSAAP